ncbi:MAG TPA: hypothetical protein VE476_12280 [Propionibacteriaceae bacterium]|nr:hypothetical protein [Propionibacteriaceae bacterium]
MLTQLRRAGWLDRVRGVLVGYLGGSEVAPVVADRLGHLGCPWWSMLRSGTATATWPSRSAPTCACGPTGTLTLS